MPTARTASISSRAVLRSATVIAAAAAAIIGVACGSGDNTTAAPSTPVHTVTTDSARPQGDARSAGRVAGEAVIASVSGDGGRNMDPVIIGELLVEHLLELPPDARTEAVDTVLTWARAREQAGELIDGAARMIDEAVSGAVVDVPRG